VTGPGAPAATDPGDRRLRLCAYAILAAAVSVRVVLVVRGYSTPVEPTQDEEAEVFRSLRYGSGDLRPTMAAWGALPSYLLFFLYGLLYLGGRLVGTFRGTDDLLRLYLEDPRVFFLVGRALYAAAGVGLLVAVHRLARREFGPRAALVALGCLAFLPLPLESSRVVKADVLAALLGVLAFTAALGSRALAGGRTLRHALAAGALFGAAAGVKYHLVLLAPAFVLALRLSSSSVRGREIACAAAAAAGAFLLCNPAAVADPGGWLLGPYGVLPMFTDKDPRKLAGYRRADLAAFFAAAAGGAALAIPLLLAAPAGFLLRSRAGTALGAAALSFAAALALQRYVEPHHLLPVLPMMAVLLGGAVDAALRRIPGRPAALAAGVLVAAACAPSVLGAAAAVERAGVPGTVPAAGRWVREHIPDGSAVLLDWAYVPRLNRSRADVQAELDRPGGVSAPRLRLLRAMLAEDARPSFRIGVLAHRLREQQDASEQAHFDLDRYRTEGFRYAVTSGWWHDRFFRGAPLPGDDAVRRFYERLRAECPLLARFEPRDGALAGPVIEVRDLGP